MAILDPGRNRRAVRLALAALALTFAVFAASTVPGVRPTPGYNVLLDAVLSTSVVLLAGLVCLLRAWLVRTDRAAWAALGAGLLGWAAANAYYTAIVQNLDPEPAFSPADIGYLALYPLAYAGIIWLVRGRVRRLPPSVWLDGLVGGLGAAAVAAAALFGPILADTGGSPAAVAVNLPYPLGDLLLLVLVVGAFALLGWRPDRSWWLLGGGFVGSWRSRWPTRCSCSSRRPTPM